MTFINRQTELKDLEILWKTNKPQFVIFYGKRRVGKTELIKQFIKNKDSIYYLADQRPSHDQLNELSKRIGQFFSDTLIERNGFQNWVDVFDYLKKNTQTPFILAIDEYPYLTEGDPAIGSLFQKGWDEYLKNSPVFLILCGSSISMMEEETLIYSSPLYGRRTADFLIHPMSHQDARQFFPSHFSFVKFMEFFTITGGMPTYLSEFSAYSNRETAVKELVFKRNSKFIREIEFLLKIETREPKTYMSILSAIALGNHTLGKIASKTGLTATTLNKYIGILIRLRFIKREHPVTEKNPEKSKKSLYFLADFFFRFWFRYVFPNKSELELEIIDPLITHMTDSIISLESYVYEEVCREWLKLNRLEMFMPQKIGRYWSHTKSVDVEIDVVAINERENTILFGEVKWSKHKIGTNILDELIAKSQQVEWGKPKRKEIFILFSKSGFTKDLITIANAQNILLVEQDKRIC